MPRIRERIFLATKTEQRDRDAAWAQINHSLERLRTDRVDLIQIHAVGDLDELDRVTGPGGSLESAVRARDEGLAGAVGITGHGHQTPATHREALRRFGSDTVLTPLKAESLVQRQTAPCHQPSSMRPQLVSAVNVAPPPVS